MKQLTKNFTDTELTRSNTADRLKLDNTPSPIVQDNLSNLALHVLQPLRDAVGEVHVNCGYRSEAVNRAVGGALNSQHLTGEAADIATTNNREAFAYIMRNLPFDQLIWENGDEQQPAWIHVSYSRTRQRKQVLRKLPKGGYLPFDLSL